MNSLKKRVLLVDDDEEVLQTVQIALERRGYDVLLARNGTEGLVRAERDAPDLIILDLIMPRRSGLTVLDRLHRTPLRAPRVIMLTANSESRYRHLAESHGADVFLAKPFDMTELLSEVDALLQA